MPVAARSSLPSAFKGEETLVSFYNLEPCVAQKLPTRPTDSAKRKRTVTFTMEGNSSRPAARCLLTIALENMDKHNMEPTTVKAESLFRRTLVLEKLGSASTWTAFQLRKFKVLFEPNTHSDLKTVVHARFYDHEVDISSQGTANEAERRVKEGPFLFPVELMVSNPECFEGKPGYSIRDPHLP
jgi:hypothetical protein